MHSQARAAIDQGVSVHAGSFACASLTTTETRCVLYFLIHQHVGRHDGASAPRVVNITHHLATAFVCSQASTSAATGIDVQMGVLPTDYEQREINCCRDRDFCNGKRPSESPRARRLGSLAR